MLNIPKIEFQPYFELAWRRKWWIVIPLCLVLICAAGYASTRQKMYRARTLILIESQRVPQSFVQSTVTESLRSRLNSITQQVKSRTNMENLITRLDLFSQKLEVEPNMLLKAKKKVMSLIQLSGDEPDDSDKEFSMTQKVNTLRGRINVNLTSRNKSFQVSCVWPEAQVAADVANAVASQFIEHNLKFREEMAMGTTDFLETEVNRIRRDLIERERALQEFKQKHKGRLPSQLQSNLNILSQKRDEINNLENRLSVEQQQAMMIRNNLKNNEYQIEDSGGDKLSNLKNHLRILKLKYTNKHPDVRALKRNIEKLQQEEKRDDANATDEALQDELGIPDTSPNIMLEQQLDRINARIAKYERQIRELKSEIKEYQARVEQTPEVELELKNLQRNYGTVRGRYSDILSKQLSAEMSEELEKRQKGEQFRVIDSARPPGRPFKPDVKKIMVMAAMLGFGLGGGLAFVRETLDPGFYTVEEVESSLGAKVVVSLPLVEKKANNKLRK